MTAGGVLHPPRPVTLLCRTPNSLAERIAEKDRLKRYKGARIGAKVGVNTSTTGFGLWSRFWLRPEAALCLCVSFLIAASPRIHAQGGRGAQPPATARAAALVDFAGYWVSVVTEDWRWRMVTPARGDFASIPLNAAGRKAGEAWDPAKDEAAGEQCKAYGAGGIMRLPGRLHITWQDDNTLRIDTDEGMQTRLLHFDGKPPEGGPRTWQGYSVAQWEKPVRGTGAPAPGLGAVRQGTQGRSRRRSRVSA